ncbi:2-hydroxychromene-2-carboxylate isomerase [Herbaspirillum sp. alder98]|uniref:2-hydroxychromene-2-carboxylate isomerase n=1 Tax=Herbaspirillum sp. alder98 TaxID=2913096 RepID=UPI001CD8E6BD|nr:2-hydroxychromene-2-carboxylate isomerase [Herbaspirillum sp. alder98]MCA1325343.1 2-hydroxychromene-2-carboxylate isomerase [Herbaspirillum sp. alder98]
MSKVCEYFFAPHSPFAYLGHDRFVAMAEKHQVQVIPKPFDLSKIFGVSGGLPLAKRAPQRQAYRLKELARWSEFLGKPMVLQPTHFPVNSDTAARMIIAVQLAQGSRAALELAGAFMRAVWEEQRNIADTDTLVAIANAQERDGATLLKSAETASVQAEFDRFTDEANAASVFGAPWFIYQGEGYWGQDRLDFVERAFARS